MNNTFTKLNTASQLLYLLTVILVTVGSVNPLISAAAAISAVAAVLVYCDKKYLLSLLRFSFPLCLFILIFNIFFNHNGVTVLMYLGSFSVTKEALIFSVCSSLVFLSSVMWFSAFSDLIGSDKIYKAFSPVSKNLAIIFSLTMSMIPNIVEKGNQIKITEKAQSGKTKRSIRYILNVSALFSRTLEDSFVTAQTMKIRGALLPSKKVKADKLNAVDWLFIIFSVYIILFFFIFKINKYSIYPLFSLPELKTKNLIYYSFLLFYLFLPIIIFALEELKWLYMKSKI